MWIVTFPINVAPGIGMVAWVFWNGWAMAWETQSDLLPMIGYRRLIPQLQHILYHAVSYFGFGFTAFALCLAPFANVIFAGGIAYGAGMLFEQFVDEGVTGPDGAPVPTKSM